ncbi:hypothetical protein NC652_000689 [Populus alba x Populus x berolinensis]|uniref:Uncharacterized protein n=2 Tax=Populus TaxID=3689 RepID=A0A4U5N9L2_POPAL|nr:hypothetical protein NC652_000689 [Populus alba x Populus x berolinensis]KAJ7010067.1 hypothetical protein NC653_000712 [Populus alba x Populus x berolinensis]TKR79676.1 hypothetical protein D5086_0000269380 [Populus alba]
MEDYKTSIGIAKVKALTLDQSNCSPRVLHRNFRNKTEAETDLHVFPPDGTLSSSQTPPMSISIADTTIGPRVQTRGGGVFSSSANTFLSFSAVNRSLGGPWIAL